MFSLFLVHCNEITVQRILFCRSVFCDRSYQTHLSFLYHASFQARRHASKLSIVRSVIISSVSSSPDSFPSYLRMDFLMLKQSLVHGANILSRYLAEKDTKWIDDLDNKRLLKGEINIKDVIVALQDVFPDGDILDGFVDMLLFDCLTGNNDRHYYNWGVVTHIRNKHKPYYSPIYDTTRGLYWNNDEKLILSLHKDTEDAQNKRIAKYVKNSVPKISVPGNEKCNHFQLIEYLKSNNYIKEQHITKWTADESLEQTLNILNKDFVKLFTLESCLIILIIKKILNLSFNKLKSIINQL